MKGSDENTGMQLQSLSRFLDPGYVAASIRRRFCSEEIDEFLGKVKGIIHVGANTGQERDVYAAHDLNVIWVEPIPAVFQQLEANIRNFPKQRAILALAADQDGMDRTLHISSNGGLSSSILEFSRHQNIWPDIGYVADISVKSETLSTLVRRAGVDLGLYDSLLVDTQGSELLVLQGAIEILPHLRFIQVEAADFEAYKGCPRLKDISVFLRRHGYREWRRRRTAVRPWVGSYYDVVFESEPKA